ncbi:hypothetical protein ACKVWC_011414 [Pyricularia oryzae]
MDALRNLNIPDWLKRLEELNDQAKQRQLELAGLAEPQQRITNLSLLETKASTESIRSTDPNASPLKTNARPAPKTEPSSAVPTKPTLRALPGYGQNGNARVRMPMVAHQKTVAEARA